MNVKTYQIFKIATGSSAPQKYKVCEDCGEEIKDYRILIGDQFVCMDCLVKGYAIHKKWIFKVISLLFRVGFNLYYQRVNSRSSEDADSKSRAARKAGKENDHVRLETTGEEAGTWNPGA